MARTPPRGSARPMTSALPPSSLIISSRNRHALLKATIQSVLNADVRPSELIVVDQSDAPDAELEQLQHADCAIRYLWTTTTGASRGRNFGAAHATHPLLVFIDDDMHVAPDWYAPLIDAVVDAGPRAAVTGRVMAGQAEGPNGFVIAVHAWEEPRVYAGRIGRDILATGHMAMYRGTLESVGGLDERLGPGTRFPGAEDNDLGFRLLETGCQIVYVPDSVIYHRAWRTPDHYVPLFWNYGRGQGAFYAKHFRLGDWYMLGRLRKDVSRYVRLLPRRIWHRQLLQLAGSTASLAGMFVGGAQWLLIIQRAERV